MFVITMGSRNFVYIQMRETTLTQRTHAVVCVRQRGAKKYNYITTVTYAFSKS